jgi:triosephosphate isomerase
MQGRKMIIGGNWKCNGSIQSIKDLVNNVLNQAEFDSEKLEVVVSPISIHMSTVQVLVNDKIKVMAQNVSATGTGAFTGEVSAEQMVDAGFEWVLIGHSERRCLYGETDAQVAAKVAKAQSNGLNTIVCVGEQLDERESGETNTVLKTQLDAIKDSVKDWSKVVIAYEPVWAIGTGKTATPEIADETHAYIRLWFSENVSDDIACSMRIQYGGSVNGKSAPELIKMTNIDGFLVGGASLKPEFRDIITSMNNHPDASA